MSKNFTIRRVLGNAKGSDLEVLEENCRTNEDDGMEFCFAIRLVTARSSPYLGCNLDLMQHRAVEGTILLRNKENDIV